MPVEMIAATGHAGTAETPYLRGGKGESLVLLTTRGVEDLSNDPLLAALTQQFRVIVPLVRAAAVQAGWLRGFLDCLGVQDARILIDAPGTGAADHAAALIEALGRDAEALT